MDVFTEISLILATTLVVSAIMRLLRQPLLIGYIVTGLLVGPYFFNILRSTEVVTLFSQLGITALLFVVGLGLSPKVLKELGGISLLAGFGQISITTALGFFLATSLGFGKTEALYISIAFTFSSTIIILKLLSDKGDLTKLYGRIAIGLLLVQDLMATILLVVIASLGTAHNSTNITLSLLFILAKGLIMLVLLLAISSFILPRLTKFIAGSQEFLFVSSLAWGMGISALYHYFGLSVEIGALVAGVTLAMTPYSHEISSRFKPLRDFFIILFFILLGYQMVLSNWQALIVPTLVFTLFVILIKPLIVFVLMNLMGYSKRIGFFTGTSIAQISEFSLILITLGYKLGHISINIPSITTFVGILTIAISTYLISYSEKLFKLFSPLLSKLEFRKNSLNAKTLKKGSPLVVYDALLFGYKRVGAEFARAFKQTNSNFIVVDFNPVTVQRLQERGILCEYGDADDIEFLQELPLSEVKIVVSTIPDFDTNELIVHTVRAVNEKAVLVIVADTLKQAEDLYKAGVTHVIMPHYLGAHYAAELIIQAQFDEEKHKKLRNAHLDRLREIKEVSIEDLI